jgi:hypothetical protein
MPLQNDTTNLFRPRWPHQSLDGSRVGDVEHRRRMEKFGVTGTPTVEIKQCDMAGVENTAGGASIFNESGTTVYLTNSDAPASVFSGTVVNRNSNVA